LVISKIHNVLVVVLLQILLSFTYSSPPMGYGPINIIVDATTSREHLTSKRTIDTRKRQLDTERTPKGKRLNPLGGYLIRGPREQE
jgi:hypothetical protein